MTLVHKLFVAQFFLVNTLLSIIWFFSELLVIYNWQIYVWLNIFLMNTFLYVSKMVFWLNMFLSINLGPKINIFWLIFFDEYVIVFFLVKFVFVEHTLVYFDEYLEASTILSNILYFVEFFDRIITVEYIFRWICVCRKIYCWIW